MSDEVYLYIIQRLSIGKDEIHEQYVGVFWIT